MYMVVVLLNRETRKLKVHNYNFEKMANFEYLGVDINENAYSYKEIKLSSSKQMLL